MISDYRRAALALAVGLGLALPAHAFTACQVTDVGGIDDNSFNQTAWQGVLDAQDQLGIDARFLESQAETDYEANLKLASGWRLRCHLHNRFPSGRCHTGRGGGEPRPDVLDRRLRL
ncbi:BMP family ABC transporter substrate-binding protein [Rhodophyticola porphyridii]|uniref:BMP family ABC transporter substrate-binding protein n=1 Tax=Rhodophyticola porphyridii TaxID=1852017 RepID=UPI0035CF52C3